MCASAVLKPLLAEPVPPPNLISWEYELFLGAPRKNDLWQKMLHLYR